MSTLPPPNRRPPLIAAYPHQDMDAAHLIDMQVPAFMRRMDHATTVEQSDLCELIAITAVWQHLLTELNKITSELESSPRCHPGLLEDMHWPKKLCTDLVATLRRLRVDIDPSLRDRFRIYEDARSILKRLPSQYLEVLRLLDLYLQVERNMRDQYMDNKTRSEVRNLLQSSAGPLHMHHEEAEHYYGHENQDEGKYLYGPNDHDEAEYYREDPDEVENHGRED